MASTTASNPLPQQGDKKADWSNLPATHPLIKLAAELPDVLATAKYDEMYGVILKVAGEGSTTPPHSTLLILSKFLRANSNDIALAKQQLTDALAWRREYQPLKLKDATFDGAKFAALGFIARVRGATETRKPEDVVVYNIYGAAAQDAADAKAVFGDTDEFVRWRVALQELALAQLGLDATADTIPDYGRGLDPFTVINVHDYLNVKFFRQPGEVKAASSKVIEMFQKYYPETVSYKYFVNVPLVMQWMMGAMKSLMSKDSVQKMTWMSWGSELHRYLGPDVPKEYGGTGGPLAGNALTPKYDGGAATGTAAPTTATATATAPASEAEVVA